MVEEETEISTSLTMTVVLTQRPNHTCHFSHPGMCSLKIVHDVESNVNIKE